MNVDHAEVERYDAWADEWWRAGGEFEALRRMHQLHLSFLRSVISVEGIRALDVGCGGGLFSEMLATHGAKVTGIDPSAESVRRALQHARQSDLAIEYRSATIEQVAHAEPESYDLVTCTEVLEHVPDAECMVANIARAARPGGWVFLSTENRTLAAYLGAIFAAERILHFTPPGAQQWRRFIKPAELIAWAREGGLAPIARRGISYNTFTRDFHLTPWMGISYVLVMKRAA